MGFKEWWGKSNLWKQGFFIGLLIFIFIFIYGIIQIATTNSDMKWVGIMIPIFPLVFLFDWYAKLDILNWISIVINLLFYYSLGIIIALIIKKIKKIK